MIEMISGLAINKNANQQLARYYAQIAPKHNIYVGSCASNIYGTKLSDDYIKILSINFCKDKLCPICNEYKYRKNKAKYEAVYDYLKKGNPSLIYVDLVITIKNCAADNLKASIALLDKSFAIILKHHKINAQHKNSICKGYVKSIHIDYSGEYFFHPHIQTIIAFESKYRRGENYINKGLWQTICKDSLGVSYDPYICVKTLFPDKETHKQDICNILTYVEKHFESSDYCGYNNQSDEENMSVVETLFTQITPYQKLFSNGGVFREAIGLYNSKKSAKTRDDIIGEQTLFQLSCRHFVWDKKHKSYVVLDNTNIFNTNPALLT